MPPLMDRTSELAEDLWAIYPRTLRRLVSWSRGEVAIEPGALVAQAGDHTVAVSGSVAVIPITGVIEHHSDWLMELFGGTSVDGLRADLHAAMSDPQVQAIVLDVDSPGGTVPGVTELAAEIRAARGGDKPIVAVANAWAASAAYWLASQADELVAIPSAQVGSIGVYAMHQDISGMLAQDGVDITLVSAGPHKVEGNSFEPLSDEARAELQGKVDATYGTFLADVAAGRRVSIEQVRSDFGGGRMLTATDAAKVGMIDRVETLGATIARLSRPAARRRVGSRAESLMVGETDAAETDAGEVIPFSIKLDAAAIDLAQLVEHATERARLRAKEGRPAFSTNTERSLRTIRDAIETLLAPVDPDAATSPAGPDDPEPTEPPTTPLVAAPIPVRFQSRSDWLHFLEVH